MKHRQRYRQVLVQSHALQEKTAIQPSAIVRNVNNALMVIALIAGASLPVHDVMAQQANTIGQRQVYQVAAGGLGDALAEFASRAGVTVQFNPALVEGRRTTGLSGNYSILEGFSRLLAGTGLDAIEHSPGTYILRAATEATLPVVTVAAGRGDAGSEGTYRMPVVSVFKGQNIKEVPHSVSVVTRQQIEEQNLISLTDVLDKTTGVTVAKRGALSSSYANDSNYYSRGFAVSNVQMDGGASTAAAFGGWAGSISQLDMAQFDRVEFLRGVDGLFSSTGEPGGTINLVRKRPQAERSASISVSAGSWDNYRLEADATGAIALDGRIRARGGFALEDKHYFYDTAKDHREVIYGALETDLTPDTVLTVGGSYQRNDGVPFSGGLPRYVNGEDINLPRHTALTADWNTAVDQMYLLYARLEHNLNADWRLQFNVDRLQVERDAMGLFNSGGADPLTGLGGFWFAFPAQTGSTRTTLNANIKGTFEMLGRQHELIAGADIEKGTAYSHQANTNLNGTEFNIFNPPVLGNPGRNPQYNWWDYDQQRTAVYGSLKVSLTDPLKLIIGGRYSRYSYDSTATFSSGAAPLVINFKESGVFTPYVGMTYALNPLWTAYASYAETYLPQFQQLAGPLPGKALDPVTSKNYEIGIKGELIPAKLNTTFAMYRIDRTGEAMADPAYPQSWGAYNCCYLNRGKVVSQGFDAEISGEVLTGLQLIAGYTFNHNQSKDSDSNERYNSITPRHLLKFWGTYQLPAQANKWKVGAGVQMQSAHYVNGTAATYNPQSGEWDGGDVPFKFAQGGYAIWSARIDYQIDQRWSVALNVNNIFDKRYYQTVGTSRNANFYGDPVNAMLSLRGKF